MKTFKILLILSTLLNIQFIHSEDKPNVLFIAIDDLRNFVGSYGYKQAITPNLDRLAEISTVFTNAHNQAPMCGPSRTATMTGIQPYNSGAYGFVDWRKVPYFENRKTINQHFTENGYTTLHGGKIYHGNSHQRNDGDWAEIYCKAQHKNGTWGWKEMKKEDRIGNYWTWKKSCGPSDVPEENFHDTITADKAVKQLQREFEKPWFLAVGFTKPHLPWIAPRKYFDMYDLDQLEIPTVLENDISDTPEAAQFASYQVHSLGIDNEGTAKELLHAYLACITYMDAQVGKVLDALENRSDKDNTIIVLWSDHGWHLGEKQCWSKFTLWDESTRNPLMISAPNHRKTKSLCNAPVQLIDIFPTLIELCGIEKPNHTIDGHSLVPLLEDAQSDWPWPAITSNGRDSYALTFKDWRYNQFFDGSEELYDHKNDPLEHTNLANNPEYKAIKDELKKHIPEKSAPNVSDGKEWMLWLEDYPRMDEWRKEMADIKKHLAETGKVNHEIFRRYCRKAAGK